MSIHWFKTFMNFYHDERFYKVEEHPKGASYLYYYFKLQSMALRCNQGGGIYSSEKLPHTAKSIARQWHCRESNISNALKILEDAGLIATINDAIFIVDWDEMICTDTLEQIREKNRERKRKSREKQKAMSRDNAKINCDCPTLDIDIEKEIEKDLDLEVEKEKEIIEEITQSYNAATPFPKIKILSEVQKKAVLSAVGKFGLEQMGECFRIAGESEFLNGSNKNGWIANFDWIIKPENITKILNGNYSKVYAPEPETSNSCSFDTDEFIQAALRRGFGDD